MSAAGAPRRPAAADGAAAWRRLGRAMQPRLNKAQVAAGLLCALLGFAAATQVRQVEQADFSELRQDELVEVLDQLDAQAEQLARENAALLSERDRLETSWAQGEEAQAAAEARAETQGILAGTLPAVGPGVEVEIRDPEAKLTAAVAYLLVDELRNAGAEVIAVGGQRVTASSYFESGADGTLLVDGAALAQPYQWSAIGDAATLATALGVPGGALAAIRTQGGATDVVQRERLEITAVKSLGPAEYAVALE
ncbi:MAG: DUF881 domain-containing protein [Bifidobacteriaceae bacterium]|jgi:uncharacterized protein YlxW (UPF0749 family)|nr:DUF881 domain-containing protein [Bifidobacteriaceae bacterium]